MSHSIDLPAWRDALTSFGAIPCVDGPDVSYRLTISGVAFEVRVAAIGGGGFEARVHAPISLPFTAMAAASSLVPWHDAHEIDGVYVVAHDPATWMALLGPTLSELIVSVRDDGASYGPHGCWLDAAACARLAEPAVGLRRLGGILGGVVRANEDLAAALRSCATSSDAAATERALQTAQTLVDTDHPQAERLARALFDVLRIRGVEDSARLFPLVVRAGDRQAAVAFALARHNAGTLVADLHALFDSAPCALLLDAEPMIIAESAVVATADPGLLHRVSDFDADGTLGWRTFGRFLALARGLPAELEADYIVELHRRLGTVPDHVPLYADFYERLMRLGYPGLLALLRRRLAASERSAETIAILGVLAVVGTPRDFPALDGLTGGMFRPSAVKEAAAKAVAAIQERTRLGGLSLAAGERDGGLTLTPEEDRA